MLVQFLLVAYAGWTLADHVYDLYRADDLFQQFMVDHNKNYHSFHEMQQRFRIFRDNLAEINEYNTKHGKKIMGINRFSDLSKEEFASTHLGCTVLKGGSNCTKVQVNRRHLPFRAPASFDWRDHGVVTSVKDQITCGSCWAFSTIGNVESQYALKHNVHLDLSEQQEVDCDSNNHGCSGGFMDRALANIMNVGGLMSEEDYPYMNANEVCMFDPNRVQVKVTGCLDFSGADEESIKDILVNYGPLTVALSGDQMQQYHGGVLVACDPDINHALLVVGYGTDEHSNEPYWIIKNSWADSWGEDGYLRLAMSNPDCQFGRYGLVTSLVA